MMRKIILASQSPRRLELLKQIGVEAVVIAADIDETPLPNEAPEVYVQRMALEKAQTVRANITADLVQYSLLAADTTVEIAGNILGKPENDADAAAMLQQLSGKIHRVHTAIALIDGAKIHTLLSTTQVEMCTISPQQLAAYLASGQQCDKAGSYAIQGLAAQWIKKIEGSYSGVMGLPLYETAQLLNAC